MTERSISDILADVENPSYKRAATARVLIGPAVLLLDEHAELDRRLVEELERDRTENREPVAPSIAQAIAELQRQIEDAHTEFRFVAIGRRAWADLVAAHPPSKEDLKRDQRAEINSVTFPVAAVAASCASPEMTVDEVKRLEAGINDTQWALLWAKCLEANLGGATTPKSAAAGSILRASGLFATTAASEESLEASSSEGL